MARIDKYQPEAGGTRGSLAEAFTATGAPLGVGIDVNGRVVAGAGTTGIVGVIMLPADRNAGEVIDVMTNGEIVDFDGAAGTVYTANTETGEITDDAASATQVPIGFTVEATRLVVRKSVPTFDLAEEPAP